MCVCPPVSQVTDVLRGVRLWHVAPCEEKSLQALLSTGAHLIVCPPLPLSMIDVSQGTASVHQEEDSAIETVHLHNFQNESHRHRVRHALPLLLARLLLLSGRILTKFPTHNCRCKPEMVGLLTVGDAATLRQPLLSL